MDLTSPLKPDVYRVFVVIFLPGLLASFPWLGWFFWPDLLDLSYWKDGGLFVSGFILAIAMIAGMVLEDVGADIEVRIIDPHVCRVKQVDPQIFDKQWAAYLLTSANDKFVAHRYLRAMVTRFKFELAMIPACASVGLALALACLKGVGFDLQKTIGFLIADVALMVFLLDQARKGAWQLHEMRLWICSAEPPSVTPEPK